VGALGVDAPAYREALEILASGRYPFDEISRRVEPLDGAEDLIRTMAGETGVAPPLHGVLVPNG
jgi:alcohol dehydrogenase